MLKQVCEIAAWLLGMTCYMLATAPTTSLPFVRTVAGLQLRADNTHKEFLPYNY